MARELPANLHQVEDVPDVGEGLRLYTAGATGVGDVSSPSVAVQRGGGLVKALIGEAGVSHAAAASSGWSTRHTALRPAGPAERLLEITELDMKPG